MELTRKSFLETLKKALPGIENGNSVLQGADTFIFSNGNVYSYNDNISVSVKLPEDCKELTGIIKANELYELINKSEDDKIKIVVKDNKWIIKMGKAKIELAVLESSIFDYIKGNISKDTIWKTINPSFFDAIRFCLISNNKSVLSGIYIKDNIVTSTDEIRINWYSIDFSIEDSFWFENNAAEELLKLKDINKIGINSSWVHFSSENGTIFSCRLLEKSKYPFDKIEFLVQDNKKEEGDITANLPSNLLTSINKASIFSYNIESYSAIKLTFSKDNIEVYSERKAGSYLEEIPWETKIENDFPLVSIYLDSSMIEFGIKKFKSFYIKKADMEDGKVNKIIFDSSNGVQLVGTIE